jgi:hypothetical protein
MAEKRSDETWESFAERLIREAYDAGDFERLPGFGQPMPELDEPDDELWWIKEKIRREQLSLLPPALQIQVDVHHALEKIWTLGSERAVRSEVAEINEKIREANFAAVWGPPSTLLPLDIDEVLADWRRRREPTRP